MTRDELITLHMPIVDRIVGKLQRSGIPSNIEVDDLRSEGMIALIKTIDGPSKIALDKQVARRVEDACVRWIKRERAAAGVSFEDAGFINEQTGEMLI